MGANQERIASAEVRLMLAMSLVKYALLKGKTTDFTRIDEADYDDVLEEALRLIRANEIRLSEKDLESMKTILQERIEK